MAYGPRGGACNGGSMAAHDPDTRREAASIAARARIAAMTDDQRRDMTTAARAALHARDLAAVDDEARRLDQYPLPTDVRIFRANLRAAVRAKRASDEAKRARRIRQQNERESFEGREAREAAEARAADQGGAL